MARTIICIILLLFFLDFTSTAETVDSVAAPEMTKRGFIGRVMDYFSKSNVPRDDGKMDISFLGGPHYSSDVSIGIGLIATGLYGHPIIDTVTGGHRQNEFSIYLDATVKGYAKGGICGMHIFGRDRSRINYDVSFSHHPRRFWGIGYEAGKHNDAYTKYTELAARGNLSWDVRVTGDLFIGPMLQFQWAGARKVRDASLWRGAPMAVSSLGAGVRIAFDSRDNVTAPQKGCHVGMEQVWFPKFLGNSRGVFGMTTAFAKWYHPLWKGGVIALRGHMCLTYGDTPWTMLPTFGGSCSMRGYYEGQYTDKMEADVTAELRQWVYKRWGVAVWAGAGTVFPGFSAFSGRKILPNGGIGIRWEFKKFSNVRLDFGMGRSQYDIIFSINEAF